MSKFAGKRSVKNRPKKSPLKDKPLRNPGQSLDEEISRLVDEDGGAWVAIFMFSILLPIYEWWQWLTKTIFNPLTITLITLPLATFSIYRLYRIRQNAQRLKMARDGEKAVGQYLSELREKGYRVFHDILGDGFNIDHILIGDRGIFTIETKTYSKPGSGRAEIQFDGDRILVNGFEPERNLLVQARAQADWSKHILQESTGKSYPVKPVIVFPGWFIKGTGGKKSNLWVLNPKALPSFLEKEPIRLTAEDVQIATYHLSRYIRTQ